MIVAIHQPNFFPWYPFFQKIEQADLFIFLNHAQFQKGKLQNRFELGDKWFTMSVNKGLCPINSKRYIKASEDWRKIKNELKDYKKSLDQFDLLIGEDLVDTNSKIVTQICQMLNIQTKLVQDYPSDLTSTERIIDLCKYYGASTYLSGISGRNYLDFKKFERRGINVIFQEEISMIRKPILDIIKSL